MLPTGSLIETVHETTFLRDNPEAVAAFLQRTMGSDTADAPAVQSARSALARRIYDRNILLKKVALALERFHDPQQAKWVMAVNEVLHNAFRSPRHDQMEHLRDALPLLQPVTEHPLSGRDYSLRFLMGWLLWKSQSPAHAAPAFAEAARLSSVADQDDPYPVYSLRHLAYMQYLQGEFAAAHDTIDRAVRRGASDDLELIYEAARYAARAGDTAGASDLLTRSFALSPLAASWAIAEEDFKTAGIAVDTLLHAASHETGTSVDSATDAWEAALAKIRRLEEELGTPIGLPATLDESALDKARARAGESRRAHDLLGTTALRESVERAADDTFRAAKTHVQTALDDATTRKARIALRIGKLETELKRWRDTSRALQNEARQVGFSLTEKPGFHLPFMAKAAQRKQRIVEAQANYAATLENETEAKRLFDAERPGLRAESKTLSKTIKSLRAAMNELQIALGEVPPPEAAAEEEAAETIAPAE